MPEIDDISLEVLYILLLILIVLILCIIFLSNAVYISKYFKTLQNITYIQQSLMLTTIAVTTVIFMLSVLSFQLSKVPLLNSPIVIANNTAIAHFTIYDNFNQKVAPNITGYALDAEDQLRDSIPIHHHHKSVVTLKIYSGSIELFIGLTASSTNELNSWIQEIDIQSKNISSSLRTTDVYHNLTLVSYNLTTLSCSSLLCYQSVCSDNSTLCDKTCTNIQTDQNNCGQCGSSCVNGKCNAGFCNCTAGWNGLNCDQTINNCVAPSNPCLNGATCTNSVNNYTCSCTTGWTGRNCNQLVNNCVIPSNPCLNGASCINSFNNYTCTCAAGWTGRNCSQLINNCEEQNNPCLNGASCTNYLNN